MDLLIGFGGPIVPSWARIIVGRRDIDVYQSRQAVRNNTLVI